MLNSYDKRTGFLGVFATWRETVLILSLKSDVTQRRKDRKG